MHPLIHCQKFELRGGQDVDFRSVQSYNYVKRGSLRRAIFAIIHVC